ncbi:MAG TPA: DNA polymerase/3'-5' exonuclease PolX [Burkholderiaceae bacterium]|nr:DNA polymerase/3'-5' exonuclease PolX [Burkholderiaceae bacterium]
MPLANADVAAVFEEIADLLEIQGANPFRVRAYRNAARTLQELGASVRKMVADGADLDALPGIGPDLAAKIAEVVRTGTCALLVRLHKELPPAIGALLAIPGLGPKRVRALYQALDIRSLDQLRDAAQQGRLRGVPGFGPTLEAKILEATATRLAQDRRFPIAAALAVADDLLAFLCRIPDVQRAVAAGSLRRLRETVGDIDLLAAARDGATVIERFTRHDDVRDVLASGDTKASVVLRNGMQVDLRVVAPESFGAAWVYFTGSKAHDIALRRLGQERGLKLNEYGVYRGEQRVAGETEESVYASIGLPWIDPALREDRGEIEAARARRLPQLVGREDLRGDLHVHTRDSDGRASIEDMVAAARERGLTYLAVTDHSRRLAIAHGLDPGRLERQIDHIDRINATLRGFTVLKGIEVDILEDGTLDLPDSILARLDLVVGAVHHRFDLPRAKQTDRVLRAMDNRHFTILAHPTGRLVDDRPGYDIDLLRVMRKARQRGCFLELNAQPTRLDLTDVACRMARDEGILVAIDSDAHSGLEFDHLALGVNQARRGWLTADDVLNARPLPALRPLLAATMG